MERAVARKQMNGQMDDPKTQCPLPTIVAGNTKYAKQLLAGSSAL